MCSLSLSLSLSLSSKKRILEKQAGFSLVELSIVLVILGLLVGGVLSGQSLIRAAELRAVSGEYSRYVAATYSFRDKYFALPGDMTNATSFWGTSANCPGTSAQGSTNKTTCNGNANSIIDAHAASNELYRFWQHLANAGLIEGSYNGVLADPGGYFASADVTNSPKSKLGTGIWYSGSEDNTAGTSNGAMFNYNFTTHFFFSGRNPPSWPSISIMSASEAWNIDTKLDDGQAGRGKITARVASNCTSAATGADFAATYLLTQSGNNCFLNMMY